MAALAVGLLFATAGVSRAHAYAVSVTAPREKVSEVLPVSFTATGDAEDGAFLDVEVPSSGATGCTNSPRSFGVVTSLKSTTTS